MAGTRTQVTELYVATFMRAPDAPGIDYWVASPLSIEEIAQSFFDQTETQALYGSPITDFNQFMIDIYNNLFNRDPVQVEIDYWLNDLVSGNIAPHHMILAVINGALGTDDTILANKTLVGLDFADSGLSDYDDSVSIMSGITADPTTVEAAAAQILIWEGADGSEDFTTARNTFDDALPSDDTFSGVVNGTDTSNTDTYQAWDSVSGGLGNDTLHITSEITGIRTIDAAQILDTETLHITQNSDYTVSVDASNFDDKINNLVVDGSAGASGSVVIGTDFPSDNKLDAALENIELSISNSDSRTYVYYGHGATDGDENSSAITLTNSIAQTLVTNGIETYTIHTGTGEQDLFIADPANTTIIVDGEGDLTLTATAANHITLSANSTTIIYSNYRESNLDAIVDTIVGFESGTDKINVSAAITGAGGSTREAISTGFASAAAYTPREGDPYDSTPEVADVTRAYQDLRTGYLYIDINQDNTFHAADDMVIDMGVAMVPDDLIV